jgi:predicted O-linked N-acetylglucosamine transferase (SPINDLY family)
MHSVAYFLEPLVSHHDTDRFEIVMYSGVKQPDSLTERFQKLAALWRDVSRMPDDQFRDTVRSDNLDILVDLTGHAGGSRLTVIGQRLAPVQVSYLGYPGTTGLRTMDYRITDDHADPEGSDAWHTEELIRLAGGFLCYSPIFAAPSPGPLPGTGNGFITFGSFNNIAKLSVPAISLWARILHASSGSRLYLKAPALADPGGRQRIESQFSKHGIPGDRLVLKGWTSGTGEHLMHYTKVDIALDTFPYNGTTTTCEALWMGVPVVTLAGAAHAGRVGVSLLSSTGLTDLIATNEDNYVEIATRLANDRESLTTLRSNLRSRMQESPLCDAKRIVREIENAYQSMFAKYRALHGIL